jgi:broad specificity phosphatase PhoE
MDLARRQTMTDVYGKILLIRHGQSHANEGLLAQSLPSTGITELGRRQADAIATSFTSPPDKVIDSSFKRSRETAAPTLDRLPATPIEEWAVHEFTYLAPPTHAQPTPEGHRDRVDEYWNAGRPNHESGGGTESFALFIDRITRVRDALRVDSARSITFFSHRRFLSGLIWLSIPGEAKMSSRRMARYRHFDHGFVIKNGSIVPTLWRGDEFWIGSVDRGPEDGH